MPQFIESYYLISNRMSRVIYDFIEKYSIMQRELADEYSVPQYSGFIERTFYSDKELLLFLEANPIYDYNIYWENENMESVIKQFSVHFTDDGKMILGVAIVENKPRSINSLKLFKEIKNYLNSTIACITSEEPPPTNSIEFVRFCNERFMPIE